MIKKILKLSAFGLTGILLLFCLFFAGLQTNWAKELICQQFFRAAADAGMTLHLGVLKGSPPLQWILEDVSLQLNDTDTLSFPRAHMRIALFPLLRKQLVIDYLRIDALTYRFAEKEKQGSIFLKEIDYKIPFTFAIRSLKVADLTVENETRHTASRATLQARGKLKGGDFTLYLKATDSHAHNYAEFSIDKPDEDFHAALKLKLVSTDLLKPFIAAPPEAAFSLEAKISGPWEREASSLEPLNISWEAKIDRIQIPAYEMWNRQWETKGALSLFADRSLHLAEFTLQSDLLVLQAQADLGAGWQLKEGDLFIALPHLSRYSSLMEGSLQGEAHYRGLTATAEFSCENLHIARQPFQHAFCQLKTHREGDRWEGDVEFSAKNDQMPVKGSASFSLSPVQDLAIQNLHIQAPDTTVSGHGTIQFTPLILDGAVFAQAAELSHFASWLPESDLSGSVGAELQLTSKNSKNALNLHIAFKDLHCFEMLAHELTLHAQLFDYNQNPFGTLSFEGSRIYFPQLYLSSLNAQAHSEQEGWPFHIQAQGLWKDPLDIQTAGYWKQEHSRHHLAIHTCEGVLLKRSFDLESPFSIAWDPKYVQITPCKIRLADGHIAAAVELDPAFCKIQLQAEHFPLDLLALSYPTFTLNGSTSLDVHLEGSENQLRGNFHLLLEQADVLQGGREDPLQAKGVVQGHLENNTLQFYALLKATGQQFLEGTATLPLHVHFLPFRIQVDEKRMLSGEITMEGKLEEIFDFINMGSHHASGLFSCHLFLSKTVLSPSILGSMELQGGSYENYYTGTLLKEINARASADKHTLKLLSLSAKDDQGGAVSAQGELLLKPDLKFPYSIQASLDNLSALRFETVTGHFSGPLTLTGNIESALAEGALTVPYAHFQIPDQLPITLPVLPFTYINEPVHLKKKALSPLPIFPLHLDLKLSASDEIHVEGRGLDSEWKGTAHLKGTNAGIAANGSLQLLKGEFSFAGKTFTLTQGEITFTDKPTQGAFLNLSGTLALPDELIVTVLLRGPLTSPQLTFQSIPPQPTSSILSNLLFDKKISEINAFQAIQLAQVIVTLSGGSGPSVLETIRKSLGVDRLNIVAGKNGLTDIAVQIGKYLTHGVTVTLTQSADSSNVTIEVEVCPGFIFQAETQDQEEGKFSLKWNRNY